MRALFVMVALINIVSATIAVIHGNWVAAGSFMFGFWIMVGWFVAANAARAARQEEDE